MSTQIRPGVYQHHKGPLYRVLGEAVDGDLLAPASTLVVYQDREGRLWHQALDEFCRLIEQPTGPPKPQFRLIVPVEMGTISLVDAVGHCCRQLGADPAQVGSWSDARRIQFILEKRGEV